ncbi:MAG TPA: hypothetical protein VK699_12125 [Terriglobales bacterium]|jgi:hypothetical protein|nr:hypothetical protein [Terriglobales bacterium]
MSKPRLGAIPQRSELAVNSTTPLGLNYLIEQPFLRLRDWQPGKKRATKPAAELEAGTGSTIGADAGGVIAAFSRRGGAGFDINSGGNM